jgi:hypothetical protein
MRGLQARSGAANVMGMVPTYRQAMMSHIRDVVDALDAEQLDHIVPVLVHRHLVRWLATEELRTAVRALVALWRLGDWCNKARERNDLGVSRSLFFSHGAVLRTSPRF